MRSAAWSSSSSSAGRGAGVLLAEQHARQALAVAGRACVLRHGRIVWTGPAAEARDSLRSIEQAYLGEDETSEKERSQ